MQRYFDNSLTYDSPQAEKLRLAVKKAGMTAVLGLSERDGGKPLSRAMAGGDPDLTARPIAKRRKLRPTHSRAHRPWPRVTAATLRCTTVPASAGSAPLCCWETSATAVEIRAPCNHPEQAGARRGTGRASRCTIRYAGASGWGDQQRGLALLCGGARTSCWRPPPRSS